jgi:predicted MFS family arabinose efflux permease
MHAIRTTPGAMSLFALSVAARLPAAMVTIALLVHARHLTGSFAAAGLVTAAYAVALAVGGPVLGRLADRRGPAPVLVPSAVGATVALAAAATLPPGAPVDAVALVAVLAGLAMPPVAACARALLGGLVGGEAAPSAYAADATALELTWLAGPPLAIGIGRLASTGAAMAVVAALVLGGALALAAHPAARRPRSAAPASAARPAGRGGALRSPGVRTLVLVYVSFGLVMGAVEVGVTAATRAAGSPGAAGLLFALWGLGSLVGGAVATRRGGGARTAGWFAVVFGALAAGHGALVLGAGRPWALGALLVLAGAAIAPTNASASTMVDGASPAGSATEAFAWVTTASSIGSAAGAALAGVAVEAGGPSGAFVAAGLAGALGLAAILAGATVLTAAGGGYHLSGQAAAA